jgi:hypothetical protein
MSESTLNGAIRRLAFRAEATRRCRTLRPVRANWRVMFNFADGEASDVDYVDYH